MKTKRFIHIRHICLWVLALGLIFLAQAPLYAAQVTLAWDANDPAPDGYRIFQRTSSGAYNYASPAWSGATTTCTLTNLTDSTTYYYVVRAYEGTVESANSNEVTCQTPAPTVTSYTITASAGSNGSITPSGTATVSSGSSRTYQIAAGSGYKIASVLVDGASVGAVSSYTFSSISAKHTISASFISSNQAPVADAGPDQDVDEAQKVTLSGSNSMDNDDGIAAFQWRQIQGPTVTLGSPASEQTTFIAPDVDVNGAALVFELTVTDCSNISVKDTCIVNVSWVNMAPSAQAGADKTVSAGDQVALDASGSSDFDGDILEYQWVQTNGPAVSLSNASAASPTFIAPVVTIQGVSLTFELTVTDGGGLQATDSCLVRVVWKNAPPVAQAGADQKKVAGTTIVLNGSQSTDPDDGIAAYLWKQTQGTPVVLSDAGAISPSFTAPDVTTGTTSSLLYFQLTVTDNNGMQSTDTCRVEVLPATVVKPDVTAPSITVTSPASSIYGTKLRTITIKGTASDNLKVTRVQWKDGAGRSGLAQGTTSWQIPNLSLTSQTTVITVTAYDAAGNYKSVKRTIYKRR